MSDVPGWEGSIGPSKSQYGKPHVYARDTQSGAGNCVCGAALRHSRHVQAAPGVPVPGDGREHAVVWVGDITGEPHELRDLPPEVRHLIHRVDAMADNWAEYGEAGKRELWRQLHEANRAVWSRHDKPNT